MSYIIIRNTLYRAYSIGDAARLAGQFAMADTVEGYLDYRRSRLIADRDRQEAYRQLVRVNQSR